MEERSPATQFEYYTLNTHLEFPPSRMDECTSSLLQHKGAGGQEVKKANWLDQINKGVKCEMTWI